MPKIRIPERLLPPEAKLERRIDLLFDKIQALAKDSPNQRILWSELLPKIQDELTAAQKCGFPENGLMYFVLSGRHDRNLCVHTCGGEFVVLYRRRLHLR